MLCRRRGPLSSQGQFGRITGVKFLCRCWRDLFASTGDTFSLCCLLKHFPWTTGWVDWGRHWKQPLENNREWDNVNSDLIKMVGVSVTRPVCKRVDGDGCIYHKTAQLRNRKSVRTHNRKWRNAQSDSEWKTTSFVPNYVDLHANHMAGSHQTSKLRLMCAIFSNYINIFWNLHFLQRPQTPDQERVEVSDSN